MWNCVSFIITTFMLQYGLCAMTEPQIKATLKMARNVCQPKSQATDEEIDGLHNGHWDLQQNTKCFIHCALNMFKLITKENKFGYDQAMVLLKILPEEWKEPSKFCMDECKDSAKTLEDQCEAAYEIAYCLNICNPSLKYFLP